MAYSKHFKQCVHCDCTEQDACVLPGGVPCSWAFFPRPVCTNPTCVAAEMKVYADNEELKARPVISTDCQDGDHSACEGEESALWPDGTFSMRKCSCDCHQTAKVGQPVAIEVTWHG